MKIKYLLRAAAGCLLFFAFGHSVGHFTRHQVTDPKAKFVLQQMTENKFEMFGKMRSYDDNYAGMSLNLILTLLTFAAILWIISGQAEKHPAFARNVLLSMTMCIVGFGITSYLYFFVMPAIACLLASVMTSLAIFKIVTTWKG